MCVYTFTKNHPDMHALQQVVCVYCVYYCRDQTKQCVWSDGWVSIITNTLTHSLVEFSLSDSIFFMLLHCIITPSCHFTFHTSVILYYTRNIWSSATVKITTTVCRFSFFGKMKFSRLKFQTINGLYTRSAV